MRDDLPLSITHEVRDRCLCLHIQRTARLIARRFDEALRPFGLTNGQFSLLMSLNRPQAPRIGDLAPFSRDGSHNINCKSQTIRTKRSGQDRN